MEDFSLIKLINVYLNNVQIIIMGGKAITEAKGKHYKSLLVLSLNLLM